MNIRKFLRLTCLTVTSLFWASCDSDTTTQGPDNSQNPESSSDEVQPYSSAEPESSAEAPESSAGPALSSSEESFPSLSSSSDVAGLSSSSAEQLVLAKDPSVTCTPFQRIEEQCPVSSEPYYSCTDLQEFLKKDTTVSEKILNAWEEKLLSCDAVEEPQTLYGIIYRTCPHYMVTYLKCSDGKTYGCYAKEDGVAYVTKKEYDETHSSSSVAESSSSSQPEDLVTNCPHDGFALFADVLAEVQKDMYKFIVSGDIYELLEGEAWFTDAAKEYMEGLLDHDKKTLKGGNFAPFYDRGDMDPMYYACKESENWFDGYIAKTKTCADGTPVETDKYKETYKALLAESFEVVFEKAKNAIVE